MLGQLREPICFLPAQAWFRRLSSSIRPDPLKQEEAGGEGLLALAFSAVPPRLVQPFAQPTLLGTDTEETRKRL